MKSWDTLKEFHLAYIFTGSGEEKQDLVKKYINPCLVVKVTVVTLIYRNLTTKE